MGNHRLRSFPAWELLFEKAPDDMPVIATNKAKFDLAYQKRWGITTRAAADGGLPDGLAATIATLSKRIYRLLGLTGYARLDYRLTPDNQLYLLEANPNPQLGYGEDFAESAEAAGLKYVNIPMSASRTPRDGDMEEFLKVVDDPASGNVFVHCDQGKYRTGVATAIYRMSKYGWNFDKTYAEMRNYHFQPGGVYGRLEEARHDRRLEPQALRLRAHQ
jgi:protein tyrosine phosphatase (PTP) superfamily phosphohydrolase (DUF442 family)